MIYQKQNILIYTGRNSELFDDFNNYSLDIFEFND